VNFYGGEDSGSRNFDENLIIKNEKKSVIDDLFIEVNGSEF
jgi:hypothetical protein